MYKVHLLALQAEPLIESFNLLQPFQGSTTYLTQPANAGRGHKGINGGACHRGSSAGVLAAGIAGANSGIRH